MNRTAKFIGWSLFLALLLAVAGLTYEWRRVVKLKDHYPEICYERGSSTATVKMHIKPPPHWAHLSQIAPEVIAAVVVSEDWAFFDHRGYDLKQIRESLEENLRKGHYVRGGSTITQQVVRNVFLSKEKTLRRKALEFVMALMLERELSKRKILEIYLNIAEWGDGIHGVRRAAKHYFKKGPDEINAKEGAFLAMLLPSPNRYAASFRDRQLTSFATESIERILDKMVQAGFITHERAGSELCEPLPFESMSPQEMLALHPECEPNPMILNE